jgi:hypothetical protein
MLQTCTASLIIYHPRLKDEVGPNNSVVDKLEWAAEQAAIGADPAGVLVCWSAIVLEDFRVRNAGIPQANSTTLLQRMNQQSGMICVLLCKQTSMAWRKK